MSADAFTDTGLAAPLVAALATLGMDRPTPLQSAALPIVRRGGNLVLSGAPGSGVMLAWAAGVLERVPELEPGTPRVLVVTRDTDRAGAIADTLSRLAAASGEGGDAWRAVSVASSAPGWRSADADILVTPIAVAAAAVSASRLKLGDAGILVLDDTATLLEHHEAAMEALLASMPRDAQRILVSPRPSEAVDRLAQSAAGKAMHVPPRNAADANTAVTRSVNVLYAVEADRFDTLCDLLSERAAGEDVVFTRSRARAEQLGADLARRGFGAQDGGPAVLPFAEAGRATIAWDVPFDAAGLERLAGAAPVVLATPAERTHLRQIAAEAGIGLTTQTPAEIPAGAAASYRQEIERALEAEDIDAQLALLAPLFERHAPVELAAALSALLRRKPLPPRAQDTAPPPIPRFVRLFISAGQRDGLRPADLLGAITGESGIKGERVGRIDIRDTFSVAEIGEEEAERVIHALNGTTLRGRAVRVDFDRPAGASPAHRKRAPRV